MEPSVIMHMATKTFGCRDQLILVTKLLSVKTNWAIGAASLGIVACLFTAAIHNTML